MKNNLKIFRAIKELTQEEKMQILEFIRNGKKIVENDLKMFS